MKSQGDDMGRFFVEIEIINNVDLVEAEHGHLDPAKVRRIKIQGLVDCGAAYLVLPQKVAEKLGLPLKPKKLKVKYADGRKALRSEADQTRVSLMGREGLFRAILEPKRDTALIGAIVLEDLDLRVDSKNQRLVPRDPDGVLAEIE